MKKLSFLILMIFSVKSFAQTTIVLRPGPDQSKDAEIWSLSPTTSLGNWPELKQNAWTWDGEVGLQRGLVQFDLSAIPGGSIIQSAYLSLYAVDSPSTQFDYHDPGQPNGVLVQRITSAWDAATVAWDNRPTQTTLSEVTIPKSSSGYENYLAVDVTQMVEDMIANPSSSYGFMLKLKKEKIYRRMTFASSDCGDPSRYPSLTVIYTTAEDKNIWAALNKANVYPNPFTGILSVSSSLLQSNSVVNIYTLSGQLAFSSKGVSGLTGNIQLDLRALPSQMYLLEIVSNGQVQHLKIQKD